MSLGRLFLLFVLVPLADLSLLVWAGGRIGFLPTVAIVILTAALGSWLARREGSAAWRRVQSRMSQGGVPGPELMDGLIILISGVLLLTPGFLTDVVGLLGLIPPSRAVLRRVLAARFRQSVANGSIRVGGMGPMGGFGPFGGAGPVGGVAPPADPGVEDAEIVEETSRPLRADEPA